MTQSICVFCGARMGNDPIFSEAAKELGEIIVKKFMAISLWSWTFRSNGYSGQGR